MKIKTGYRKSIDKKRKLLALTKKSLKYSAKLPKVENEESLKAVQGNRMQ